MRCLSISQEFSITKSEGVHHNIIDGNRLARSENGEGFFQHLVFQASDGYPEHFSADIRFLNVKYIACASFFLFVTLRLASVQEPPLAHSWPPSPSLVATLRALVTRHKARRDTLKDVPLLDPRLFQRTRQDADVRRLGTAGSPGIAEGPVRAIRDASDFGKLQSGDVLVSPYSNPAWTPLFQRAVAGIVESGSAGSHAAIVAREYHIPAVMGTIEGMKRLHDGQRVRVDGTHGLVFLLADEIER